MNMRAPKTNPFQEMKLRGEKVVVVTAYDAPTARVEREAGVDIILVGDSVGVNVLGYAHERDVKLSDMQHHIAAVRRGAPDIYVIGDLPYATYDSEAQALESARALLAAGASCVKFEGARPDIVGALSNAGIDVCCHLGLESQHQEVKRRQGRTADAACKLYDDALALDARGQKFLVLELVPEELAERITRAVTAVTIGIGAGPSTDGQVLVVNDFVGITQRDFKHSRRYGELGAALKSAVERYTSDVRSGAFPTAEQAFRMAPEELAAFERLRP
jgi:3-methyl-2-oxobutanoate hydroxymethyltransferase